MPSIPIPLVVNISISIYFLLTWSQRQLRTYFFPSFLPTFLPLFFPSFNLSSLSTLPLFPITLLLIPFSYSAPFLPSFLHIYLFTFFFRSSQLASFLSCHPVLISFPLFFSPLSPSFPVHFLIFSLSFCLYFYLLHCIFPPSKIHLQFNFSIYFHFNLTIVFIPLFLSVYVLLSI